MIFLGIVGRFGSGKDTVADHLESKGFYHISLSDLLREKCRELNIELTVPNLVNMGNKMREINPGILGTIAIEKMKNSRSEKFIVSSIRNAFELEELRKFGDINILKIDAPFDVRYKRVSERKKKEDILSPMQFYNLEKEQVYGDAKKLSMMDVFKEADFVIYNTEGLEELYKKIENVLEIIKNRK
jgi:dephospho-CoA kinase